MRAMFNRMLPYAIDLSAAHQGQGFEVGCGICNMKPAIYPTMTADCANAFVENHAKSAEHYDAVTKYLLKRVRDAIVSLDAHLLKERPKT